MVVQVPDAEHTMRRVACILSISVIVSACAHGAAPATGVSGTGELRHAEMVASGRAQTSLYEAIRALRPLFLQARPRVSFLDGSAPRIRVVVDGVDEGELEVLHLLRAELVESVRRLEPARAFTQLGTSRTGDGVLEVSLRKP